MKTKSLLLVLFCCSIIGVNAQGLYKPGKVTKGEKAGYYCQNYEGSNIVVSLRNVEVKDTIEDLYYKNGKKVDWFEIENLGSVNRYKQSELVNAFKSILTSTELTAIQKSKTKGSFFLVIHFRVDERGNTKEILHFVFRNTDPVLMKMSPDRLFLLEQKLKPILKVIPPQRIGELKSYNCVASLGYRTDF